MGAMADRLSAAELTIDLAAVAANWSRLDRLSPGASTAAMVKADGYGTGAAAVAGELAAAGCTEFFVADVGEGIRLRAAVPDADIFVLAGAAVAFFIWSIRTGSHEHADRLALLPIESDETDVKLSLELGKPREAIGILSSLMVPMVTARAV